MTVRVNKSSFNIREKLSELERPIGLKGSELMRAETAQEARDFVSAGRKNRVINGDMRINQRGGTISVDTSGAHNYSIDRFAGVRGSSGVAFTLQQSSDAPPEFKNSLLITVPTGAVPSSTQVSTVVHCIEGFNTDDLSWGTSSAKTVTVSFWVKSNVTGIFPFIISNNGRTRAYGATYSINTASTWEYKTITIPGDTTGTWETTTNTGIFMYWGLGAAGSARTVSLGWSNTSSPGSSLGTISGTTHLVATTGATLQLTGVQLEVGKNATEFEHRSYGEELTLCERYYQRFQCRVQESYILTQSYMSTAINHRTFMRASPAEKNLSVLFSSNANQSYTENRTDRGFDATIYFGNAATGNSAYSAFTVDMDAEL